MATGDHPHFPLIHPPCAAPAITAPRVFEPSAAETPKRHGIIPCTRCAFFVKEDGGRWGSCHRHPPTPEGRWTAVGVDKGCGEGLLREEAAPLPPEVR